MAQSLVRGSVFVFGLLLTANLQAQPTPPEPVKPSGPAAKKAEDLIKAYTSRIEKEIAQDRKEVDRLRAELHELIDLRYAMTDAIAEIRGELATKGTYSADFVVPLQAAPKAATPSQTMPMQVHRDFVYGLGSALPKDPTQEQREQLRRLAPRSDLKRIIKGLREQVEETLDEVDQLAYKLLELQAGVPSSFQGFGGGMMMGGLNGSWFNSIGIPSGGMGAGMR